MTETTTETQAEFGYNEHSRNACGRFLTTVGGASDRAVVLNPDHLPDGFWGPMYEQLRETPTGQLHARAVSGDPQAVELLLDSHDSLATGLSPLVIEVDPSYATCTRVLKVDLAHLLKAEVSSAFELHSLDQVIGDHAEFTVGVTLRNTETLRKLLPTVYLTWLEENTYVGSREDLFFKAQAKDLGEGVYELMLLMGGRSGSPEVTLGDQYLLNRHEDGISYGWTIYATSEQELPVKKIIKVGEVYALDGERPALVLTEADAGGRHRVAYLDGSDSSFGRAMTGDLLPLSEGQQAQRDDWTSALTSSLVRLQAASEQMEKLANDRLADLTKAREAHEKDIETISDKFIEESIDRGWCSEYDEVIDILNRDLTIPLRDRTRKYDVRVRVTHYVDIEVEARDRDHAERLIEDDNSLVLNEMSESDLDSVRVTEVSLA